jgi:hypothetical protein
MAVTLNASTSSGLVQTADTSGEINIQSNGTTVLGVTSTGISVTGTQSVSGNLSFNSGYGSSAVAYGCRAWVNFDGTGTPAIRASGNVSSITDNGTGDYTVNFTTAISDANYSVTAALGGSTIIGADLTLVGATAPTTAAIRLGTRRTTDGILIDTTYVDVAIFR